MAKKTRVAFKMRSSNSTPFKQMGSSPVKGKLDDLIKNFGAELKRGTQRRVDKKYESAGPNVRKQMEKEGYAKPIARTPGSFSTKQKLEGNLVPNQDLMSKKVEKAPKSNYKVNSKSYTFSGKKGDKFKYKRKTVPFDENQPADEFQYYNPAYEFQRPGSDTWETSKTKAGNKAIDNLFWSADGPHTKDPYYSPPSAYEKSPTKKSGFKMKNSPAKNYKKGYYGA